MPVFMTFEDDAGATVEVRADAVLSVKHSLKAEATEHPVEKGEDVADHVLPSLDRVTVEVFISNQPTDPFADETGSFEIKTVEIPKYEPRPPLNPAGALTSVVSGAIDSLLSSGGNVDITVLTFDNDINFARRFYEGMQDLQDNANLVRVLTNVREYENMIIESIEPVRDRTTGDGMRFVIEFKEIEIVQTEVVAAPIPEESRGFKKQNRGSKATSPGDASGGAKSLAASLVDAF